MPATRLTLGNYSIWIEMAGQEIEHHSIEVNEEEKVVSCWIASEEGKAFTIDAQKTHVNHACVLDFYLDGHWVGARLHREDFTQLDSMSGTQTGLGTERPFIFASLKLTDDDSFLTSADSAKDIGEIKVDICRASDIQDVETPTYKEATLSKDMKVHERVKKATEHRVQSGQEVEVPARMRNTCQRLEKVATFLFRYRSLGMLQANGLVAREPTPVERDTITKGPARKRKSEVNEDEDSEELEARREEAELLAQVVEHIRNARAARRRTKPPKKKVKEEPKPVFLRGEVIDLT